MQVGGWIRTFAGLLLLGAFFAPSAVMGQATIEGTIVSSENEEPLPGVNVVIDELSIGGITNEEGDYSFTVPAEQVQGQQVTIVAQFIGFEDVEKEITLESGSQTVDFTMGADVLEMENVVVTGVAEATEKTKVPFSVSQVGEEELEKAPPATDPVSALQGRVAGVQVVRGEGTPGTGSSIRLRGVTSITGGSEPLFIVDGTYYKGDMVDLDALDVESMEVVKGAAAASIYGSQAQNGVVRITTKRGAGLSEGQTRVNIRNEFGINQLEHTDRKSRYHDKMLAESSFTDPDGNEVEPGDWLRVEDDEVYKAEHHTASDANDINGLSFQDNSYPVYHDNLNEFFDPGSFYRNSAAVSQNQENTNFRISFANVKESGVVQGAEGYDRQNARVNIDHTIRPGLTVSVSGYASFSNRDNPRTGGASLNPWPKLLIISPAVSLDQRDENGEYVIQPDPGTNLENPLYLVENADLSVRRQRTTGNFRLEYAPADWLDLEGAFSYQAVNRNEESFYDKGFKTVSSQPLNDGRYNKFHSRRNAWDARATATITKWFGDLRTRTRLNALVEKNEYRQTSAGGTGLAAQGVPDLDNVTGDMNPSSHTTDVRGAYGFLSTQLDFRDRYIADLLVRRDGSSKFGPQERWHTYFRASGAYRVSQEPWWPFKNAVNEFKLRYSYGTGGGQPNFQARYETYNVGGGRITKGNLGNENLKPEFQTEQSFGLDFSLFDRVSAEFTYSRSTVEDQLLQVPLAGYYGFSSQWQNAGAVESSSIEAQADVAILQGQDLQWSTGLVFSKSTSKITEFDRPGYRTGPYNFFYYDEGEQFGTIYGSKYIRSVDDLPEDMQQYSNQFEVNDEGYLVAVGEGNSWRDGISDELWGTDVDVDGDGEGEYEWGMPIQYQNPDGSNDVVIGQSIPDFNLGVNTNVSWKGFNAFMLWDAQVGGDVYNYLRHWTGNNYFTTDQDGKPDAEKKPTRYFNQFQGVNNRYVEDGTYLKLRELSVGYTFDSGTLESILGGSAGGSLNQVSLNITGRNLLTFTEYSGYDPEVGRGNATLTRFEGLYYPNYRTFTGKVEIVF